MREIKFRANICDRKEWIYFTLGDLVCKKVDEYPGVIWKNWCQYTGLKDKNGKEIYEGDKVEGFGQTGIVIWSTTAAMFNVCGFYNSSFDFPTCAFSENMDFKIIGNIHEDNP